MPQEAHLAPEDWLSLARETLVAAGIDDVKVDKLAKRLKVTRGSFYWHFKSRDDLLAALLRDWEIRNLVEIAQIRDRWSESEPDLTEVQSIWLGEDPAFPPFDIAVRMWARKSPIVAKVVHRLDEAWINLFRFLFRANGCSEDESLVRARVAYFHQVGYYALAMREPIENRMRLAPTYYEVLTGRKAGENVRNMLSRLERHNRNRK